MNWKKAFHPFDNISSYEVEGVARTIESFGLSVQLERYGRISGVVDARGYDLFSHFISHFDDPSLFLPKVVVERLNAEFSETSGCDANFFV